MCMLPAVMEKKNVAENVPEESECIDHYEQKTRNGIEYVYVFRSKSRNLIFNAYSTILLS